MEHNTESHTQSATDSTTMSDRAVPEQLDARDVAREDVAREDVAREDVAREDVAHEDVADMPEPPARERQATGEPRVDHALRRLADLADLPVSEHPPVFERIHGQLVEVLGELRSGPDPTTHGRQPG
jgi:hypothetical protein